MDIQAHATTHDIKAIVIDIDGTLLKSDHSLSEKSRKAIRDAIDAGIQVILATGKTRHSAESIIAALNLKSPGIYVQGLIITNPDGSVRHQQMLDPNIARRVITFAEQRGFEVIAYSGNRLLTKMVDDEAHAITKFGEPNPEEVGPLVNLLGLSPVHKLLIGGKPKKIKALRWQLDKQVGEDATLMTTNLDNTLEVLPYGTSKGKSMLALLREMNLNPDNVLAIGDGENDVAMIKFAGVGVAMGNAAQATKDIADFVVATNDDDGVAEAIERFILAKLKAAEVADTDKSADSDETSASPSEPDSTPDSEEKEKSDTQQEGTATKDSETDDNTDDVASDDE